MVLLTAVSRFDGDDLWHVGAGDVVRVGELLAHPVWIRRDHDGAVAVNDLDFDVRLPPVREQRGEVRQLDDAFDDTHSSLVRDVVDLHGVFDRDDAGRFVASLLQSE